MQEWFILELLKVLLLDFDGPKLIQFINNRLNLHAGVVHVGIGGVETAAWLVVSENSNMTIKMTIM